MANAAEPLALLEWVNSLDVAKANRADCIQDLSDGSLLLGIMHSAEPEVFPVPSSLPESQRLGVLLMKLQEFFGGPHSDAFGATIAKRLNRDAIAGGEPRAVVGLAEFIAWVTVCDARSANPSRQRFVESFQKLEQQNQLTMAAIVQRMMLKSEKHTKGSANSPSSRTPGAQSPSASAVSAFGLPQENEQSSERYRDLRERHLALLQERERLEAEIISLKGEIEQKDATIDVLTAERDAAQEALRDASEAQERQLEDISVEYETQRRRSLTAERDADAARRNALELEHLRNEFSRLQDEVDILQPQAANARTLEAHLERAKETIQKLQDANRTLKQSEGNSDHLVEQLQLQKKEADSLRRALEQQRADSAACLAEAEKADTAVEVRSVRLLESELNEARRLSRHWEEESKSLRDELQLLKSLGSSEGNLGSPINSPTNSANRRLLFAPESRQQTASLAEMESLRKERDDAQIALTAARSEKDQLAKMVGQALDVERLVAEKGNASAAEREKIILETTLQLTKKEVEDLKSEASGLRQDAARDAARIERLEQELKDAHPSVDPHPVAPPPQEGDAEKAAHLEHELLLWKKRGLEAAQAFQAQEQLMASAFHNLGLRYRKLLAKHERLKQKRKDKQLDSPHE